MVQVFILLGISVIIASQFHFFFFTFNKFIMNLQEILTTLKQEVAEQTNAVKAASQLITGIKSQLDAALKNLAENGVSEEQLTELKGIVTSLDENNTALSEAVAANTPAAETTTATDAGTTSEAPATSETIAAATEGATTDAAAATEGTVAEDGGTKSE